MAETVSGLNRIERDMLVSLDTKVTLMAQDIKDIKNDTKERLIDIEKEKLDSEVFNIEVKAAAVIHQDHEMRLRKHDYIIWFGMGGLAGLELFLKYYK